jgi:hypothetical protein
MTGQARAQFERYTATGSAPTDGHPGTFAVNFADMKLWTFGPTGVPVPLSQAVDFHDPSRVYLVGDFVLEGNALYRAGVSVSPGAFNPAQWMLVSGASASVPPTPTASGVYTGGTLSFVTGNQVQAVAGTGIVANPGAPSAITYAEVSWLTQTVAVAASGAAIRVLAVSSAGVLESGAMSAFPTLSRTHVVLGFAVFDSTGNITSVRNLPRVAAQSAADVGDLVAALGGPFRITGARLSHTGALGLSVSEGTTFSLHSRWRAAASNPSIATFAAAPVAAFDVIRTNGEVITAAATSVPVTVWQGGAQSPGFAVIHYLMGTPAGDKMWLQVGQTQYVDTQTAEAALTQDWAAFNSALPWGSPVVVLGAIIVMQGATDLADPAQGRVLAASSGPRASVCFEPSGFAGDFVLADGSVAMTGNLNMGGNALLNVTIDEGTF